MGAAGWGLCPQRAAEAQSGDRGRAGRISSGSQLQGSVFPSVVVKIA